MAVSNIELIPAYRDNPLIKACGPILDRQEIAKRLTYLPEVPKNMSEVPIHIRRHMAATIWDLHIPSIEGIEIAETIDLMLRQGYVRYRPNSPDFWKFILDEKPRVPSRASSATVMGLSGVGKSIAIEKALSLYPQVVEHEQFPGFVSAFRQLLWIKIDAPSSGKAIDLAYNLMRATDQALGSEYFETYLNKRNSKGTPMFETWKQKARTHMLGLVIIDEVQNLFKQAPVAVRRKIHKGSLEGRELRIIEDETLKLILSATNTWGMPILLSGTLDGMEAFSTRLSTIQRLVLDGHHRMERISSPDDLIFKQTIFPTLCRYQWTNTSIKESDDFRRLIFTLSAGVPRIYTCLWLMAHRYTIDEGRNTLCMSDFENAVKKYLQPLIPAIEALNSNDPHKIAKYEDALPKDPEFWSQVKMP